MFILKLGLIFFEGGRGLRRPKCAFIGQFLKEGRFISFIGRGGGYDVANTTLRRTFYGVTMSKVRMNGGRFITLLTLVLIYPCNAHKISKNL